MKIKTHLVIDKVLDDSPVFCGTAEQCEDWVAKEKDFGYKVVHMNESELRMHNPEFIAKSGRFYRSIPDGMDIEVWDSMTVVERLNHMGLIVERNNTDPL